MQSEDYRETLEGALKNLVEVTPKIYDSNIPIAMTGELSEWNSSVPIGETHYFDFDFFKNFADTNIQLLVKLIEKVEETYQAIKNVNAIETKEEGEGEEFYPLFKMTARR